MKSFLPSCKPRAWIAACSETNELSRQPVSQATQRVGPAEPRRRQLLLSSPLALAATLLGDWLEERQPERGNCPTCIGAVDGTLGSCSDTTSCLSSYDDRPAHFLPPWQYEERSVEQAMKRLLEGVKEAGASYTEQEGERYLYVVFPPEEGSLPLLGRLGQSADDVEFLFADDNDTRVEIRSASRLPSFPDGGRQQQRLEALRARLGWEQVPILRNRRRALVVIESPWDSYGPSPDSGQELGGMKFEDIEASQNNE